MIDTKGRRGDHLEVLRGEEGGKSKGNRVSMMDDGCWMAHGLGAVGCGLA